MTRPSTVIDVSDVNWGTAASKPSAVPTEPPTDARWAERFSAAHADILIFDEPTRGIDVAARQDIYLLMNRLVENGAGLIMISSDLPEVLGMSDRILVMRGGCVNKELAAHEATDGNVLQAALGVPA